MAAAILAIGLFFAPASGLTLEEVLAEVEVGAPAISVERARLAAARAAIGAAGTWEDPRVTVMGEALRLPGPAPDEHPMLTYKLSQELNLFGRRGAARRVARAGVAGRAAQLQRESADARARATVLFFELWMLQEGEAVLVDQIALMERMRQAALDRVRAGMEMGHHDTLRAEAEIARMTAELASLVDQRAGMSAMLNTLRGRPAGEVVGRVAPPTERAIPSLEDLVRRAARTPEVAAARAMREEASAGRDLARKMYLPMIGVELGYEQRLQGMPDSWMAGVMVTVPLWWRDRQRNEVAMAEAEIEVADREIRAMRRMAEAELRMALGMLTGAASRARALEDSAIPAMREMVASTEAAYTAGRADFLVLLEALIALRELEMSRFEAIAARELARAELERIGGDLERKGSR
jgi:outer membrane protein, heavy metal efflux system